MFLSKIIGTKRGIVVAIIALTFVLLLCIIFVSVIANAQHSNLKVGTWWASSNPSISVVVDEEGVPRGYIDIDGKKAELTMHTRAGMVFFYLWEGTPEETLFLVGDCRYHKDRMVITNISYIKDNSDFSMKKIVLEKS